MEEDKKKEQQTQPTQKSTQEKKSNFNTDKLLNEVEKHINVLVENGLKLTDVDTLGKLIDIHKDLANEKYWNTKEEMYMYEDYGRRGRSRYRGMRPADEMHDHYGRRGVSGTGRRYRGEHPVDEMREHYDVYSEASEESRRGNYGAEGDMVKAAENVMALTCEIVDDLLESEHPEVIKIVEKHLKKMNEMI